jgi:hypothetical protein
MAECNTGVEKRLGWITSKETAERVPAYLL